MCEEAEGSGTGDGVGNESGEVVERNVEGPASALGTGISKYDACLIDSLIALAKSSCSLETFPECSFDSFSERAIASASASSSLTGACLTSLSYLGGELVGIRGGDAMRCGGSPDKGGGTGSNGEV